MIASNTKALTTLMLAKLVDEGKMTWDTPVTTLLPSSSSGDADTTSQVQVKHLICACTGLPRQDFEWLFQFKGVTPEGALATLGTMQPTSRFGEMFQYSNPLAGAAGFVGRARRVSRRSSSAPPTTRRCRRWCSIRSGMTRRRSTTRRRSRGDHATPHAPDVDGKPALAVMELNYSIIPVRPAGAAWSNIHDMLKYVPMELAEGTLPDGKRYIAKDTLLARRAPQVPIGKDATYGMGLMVDTKYGVPVVHHGGDMVGFHSDMMWLPEQKRGRGDPDQRAIPGWILRGQFRRKLLEVLFDGRPEADADVAARAKTFYDAARRRPQAAHRAGRYAARRRSWRRATQRRARRHRRVSRDGGSTVFDFGEWRSEVASAHEPRRHASRSSRRRPGISGFEFVVGSGARADAHRARRAARVRLPRKVSRFNFWLRGSFIVRTRLAPLARDSRHIRLPGSRCRRARSCDCARGSLRWRSTRRFTRSPTPSAVCRSSGTTAWTSIRRRTSHAFANFSKACRRS